MVEVLLTFTLLAPTLLGAALAKVTHKLMDKHGKHKKQ